MIPIVIGLLLTVGGSATPQARPAASHFDPVASPNATPVPGSEASPGAGLRLPPGKGALVTLIEHSTPMRATPGGHVFATLQTRTPFGSPQMLWVARRSGRWLGVVSPQAGNRHLGWIPASAGALSRVDWEIEVSLAARRLTVLHSGRPVVRYTVAIGAPAAPTPTGRFAVTDRLITGDPSGPYGCCILALSAKAPHAIQGWEGGNRIAIHSTAESSSIGQSVSHGCIRLTLAQGRWLLAHIPLGTPTLVST